MFSLRMIFGKINLKIECGPTASENRQNLVTENHYPADSAKKTHEFG